MASLVQVLTGTTAAVVVESYDENNAVLSQYFQPAPLIGFSTNTKRQGSTKLATESNVTLSFYAIPDSSDSTPRATQLANTINAVTDVFKSATRVKFYPEANAAQPINVWNVLDPSVSVDESDFNSFVRFSVSFLGVSNHGLDSVKVSVKESDDNGTETESEVHINLESFSDTLSIEPDDGLGFAIDDPTGKPYRFTRSISATVRPQAEGHLVTDSVFNRNAVKAAKAYVEARSGDFETGNSYHSDHLGLKPSGTDANCFNMTRSEQSDMGALSYSLTIQGIYNDGGAAVTKGAFETYNVSISKDSESSIVTVSVDGNLQGYTTGENQTLNQINATASDGAHRKLNYISSDGKFNYASLVFKRAQNAAGVPLNAVPKSISIADNTVSGMSISYNVSYDNRANPAIPGAISESITVNDTYPTDVYASIEVMGSRNGPVFQYMNTTTHFERDVSIEVQMDHNGVPAGNTTGLLSYSPSVNTATRAILNTLIADLTPYNANYVMLKQSNESWNPRDGRYSLNIGWIYK